MNQSIEQHLDEVLAQERKRIIGLCFTLTRNKEIAEDLAQEVLLEAWRSIAHLRDREKLSQWLSGIAHNVCLRWQCKQKQHIAQQQAIERSFLEDQLITDDITKELEQEELVELLNRALHALSPTTRQIILARYIEEMPLTEVAKRFDLQTSAVAMRLKRGKLALRRILDDEPKIDGYEVRGTATLEATSIWCTVCGQHRLLGQFSSAEAILILVCPECGDYSRSTLSRTSESHMFRGIKRIKPALSRLSKWNYRYYNGHLKPLTAPCLVCGRMTPLQLVSSLEEVDSEHFSGHWLHEPGVYQVCNDCQIYNWISLAGLSLALPEGQQFLRNYPRIRTLPIQQAEVEGRAARIIRFESVTEHVHFETVIANDRYEVVYLNGRRYYEQSDALS